MQFLPHLKRAVKSVYKALPMLVAVSLLVSVLHHGGWLRTLEGKGLSVMQRMLLGKVSDVLVVGITDDEFKSKELFNSSRPLNPLKVQELVLAVLKGSPRVVVVDIATEGNAYKAFDLGDNKIPVIWVRDIVRGRVSTGAPSSELPVLFPVLGINDVTNDRLLYGMATLSARHDELVRTYARHVSLEFPTVPWMAVKAYRHEMGETEDHDSKHKKTLEYRDEIVLKFAPEGTVTSVPAGLALDWAKNKPDEWRSKCRDKIVIVGGTFRESGDIVNTPVGEIYGAELIAQV